MKLRGILAGALAFALSSSLAFAQTNQGSSVLTGAKGGTNNAFMQFTGPATSIKTFTLPNVSDTIVLLTQSQTLTNKTLTAPVLNSPVMTTPTLGVALATSLAVNGAVIGSNALAVVGSSVLAGGTSVATSSSNCLTAGNTAPTNPAFHVDCSTGSQAAGLKVTGAVTGGTVALAAIDSGSNTNISLNAKGSGTVSVGNGSGAVTVTATAANFVAPVTVQNAAAAALWVSGTGSLAGSAFVVDTSAASPASGLKVTGAATGGTVAVAAIDTGSNANLSLNAKGSGTIAVGNVSTGGVTITPALTLGSTINKVTVTAPASAATLTIPDGVTLTGPASSGTAMTLGNTETVTGVKTFGSSGAVGRLKVAGTTSGTTVLDASPTASGTVTLPAATDTLVGKATTDTLTNKTLDAAVASGVWTASGTWTLPAATLGGTISGGGNQINNAIIGTTTPLAGSFTTVSGSTSVTSPIYQAAGKLSFKSNGTTFAGSVSTGQQWMFNANDVAPATGPAVTISKNTAALQSPSQGGSTKTNVALHIGTADASQGWVFIDKYGNANGPSMVMRSGRGTAASPTATQSGDFLFNFYSPGYGTTAQGGFGAFFGSFATETWTDSAQGSAWTYYTNAIGSTSITERMRIATGVSLGTGTDPGAGALLATSSIKSNSATAGIGYTTGAGGTVTQGTSRTTGVTLDRVVGAITLFAAAPAVGTWVSFTVTDSAVAATDVVSVSFKSGTNTYIGHVTAIAAGSFQISFTSIVGTASDSPVVNFVVIKGAST